MPFLYSLPCTLKRKGLKSLRKFQTRTLGPAFFRYFQHGCSPSSNHILKTARTPLCSVSYMCRVGYPSRHKYTSEQSGISYSPTIALTQDGLRRSTSSLANADE